MIVSLWALGSGLWRTPRSNAEVAKGAEKIRFFFAAFAAFAFLRGVS